MEVDVRAVVVLKEMTVMRPALTAVVDVASW